MAERKRADSTLVKAFAERATALPPDAWERIHVRCARLDASTVHAFLGRIELFAGSMAPEPDPYGEPFLRPAMAMIARAFGVLSEMTGRIPDFDRFERGMQRRDVTAADLLGVEKLAQLNVQEHPGTASALRAVAYGFLWNRRSIGPQFKNIYQPFEPEIPLASLEPAAA